jgi:hypothetical protein
MPVVTDESLRQAHEGLTGWPTGASSVAGCGGAYDDG